MKKYVVIVKKWDHDLREQVEVIAGEFGAYIYAKLFAEAYEAHYKASPTISELLNY